MKKLFFILILLILATGCADESSNSGDATSDTGTTAIEVTDGGQVDPSDDDETTGGNEEGEGAAGDDTSGTVDEDKETTEDQTDDTEDSPVAPIINPEISKILIGDANNLIFQSPPNQGAMYSAGGAVSTGLKTVVNGELVDIAIEGGFGKTPLRGFAIKGARLLKAAVTFQDGDGNITTCLIDIFDNCIEIEDNARKSSKFGNADFFTEQDGRLIYLTEDKTLRSRNISPLASGRMMSISGDITSDLAEGVEQFEINASGDIMYESDGDVTLRQADGTEDLMDGAYWDGRNTLRLDAFNKKFFIGRSDRGFTFYSQENYFGNLFFDGNGDPVISHSQKNDFLCSMGEDPALYCPGGVWENGVYSAINTNKSPGNCNKYTVRQKDLVICGNEVFELGTNLVDLKKINYVWAGIEGDYVVDSIIANSQFLYFYMTSELSGNRLTRVNPENIECAHLFSSLDSNMFSAELNGFVTCQSLTDTLYSIGQHTVTMDNTINFCGTRDGIDVIVQITDASTDSPVITETPGGCSQIVSF